MQDIIQCTLIELLGCGSKCFQLQFGNGKGLTDPFMQFHCQASSFPFFCQSQLGCHGAELIVIILKDGFALLFFPNFAHGA